MIDRDETPAAPAASRRAVLLGVGAVGAVSVLAACGEDTTAPASGGAAPQGAAIKVADIPVGGGKIFQAEKIVVAQPTAGTFKAFSAVCTHQGCLVTTVANGKISCPCHSSQFNIADGSVASGPAPRALTAKTVTVSGDSLTVA